MSTYNTGNPVGSTAVQDLYDNAENLDLLSLGPAAAYPDRLGTMRKSWAGFENDFAQFLISSGYESPVPYVAGLAVTRPTQTFIYQGEVYRAKISSLPFTTTTWEADSAKMIAMGDAALRADLSKSTGASLVGYRTGTVASKLDRVLDVTDFGAVGDGVTDDTAALNAAYAAGVGLHPAGVFIATTLNGRQGLKMRGAGVGKTIIRRKSNEGTNNPLLFMNSIGAWDIEGIEFDGNRSAQTIPTNTVLVQGCYGWRVNRIKSSQAKGIGGSYGTGFAVLNGANLPSLTSSAITNSEFDSNDGHGLSISKDSYVLVDSNHCVANGLDGISVTNFSNPPPTSATERSLTIVNNFSMYNSGSGVDVGGYVDAYTSGGLPINGGGHPTANAVLIAFNHLKANKTYGLVFQSANGNICHNVLVENGSNSTNGGALLNMTQSMFCNNTLDSNFYYGVDAGGATSSLFSGNLYSNNGGSSGVGCLALNVSAGVGILVNGDRFYNNGDATGGTNINIRGFDGGTDPVFPTKTSQISIKACMITQLNPLTYGINASDGAKNLIIGDNDVYGGDPNRAFVIGATVVAASDNRVWTSQSFDTVVASAANTVIPDLADAITIAGGSVVNNLYTYSRNYYDGKVERVEVGSGGSGYQPGAQIPLVFTGGGGGGAAGYGIVNNAGSIAGVTMTSLGSGYTSAPVATPSIAPPAGVVSLGVSINMNNSEGRKIRLFLSGSATLSTNGNMRLNSSFVGNGAKFIELIGLNGVWYELSRSA